MGKYHAAEHPEPAEGQAKRGFESHNNPILMRFQV
jgi:hypothetical protein